MSKVYQVITDRIVQLLEAGTVPWHKPWKTEGAPKNVVSRKDYRGVNTFLLSCAEYPRPYWLTYKQATRFGGHVRKGERGLPVIFWKWGDKIEADERDDNSRTARRAPILRYFTVFNIQQCDDLADGVVPPVPTVDRAPVNPIAACQSIVDNMPKRPDIHHDSQAAFYKPFVDAVHMPDRDTFDGPHEYHSTLFHELVHATGHESRLGRPGITDTIYFGSPTYSKEELIAEMGATYLVGHAGVERKTFDNSAAYIASWLRKLRGDNRLVIQAAGAAQKAADFILNRTFGVATDE